MTDKPNLNKFIYREANDCELVVLKIISRDKIIRLIK